MYKAVLKTNIFKLVYFSVQQKSLIRLYENCFLPDGVHNVIFKWAIYSVNENKSLINIFKDNKDGKLSCGTSVDISRADENIYV